MNTVRLHRAGTLLLAVLCFAFAGTHALAAPVTLPQPQIESTILSVSFTQHVRGESAPSVWPALTLPRKPPAPVPTMPPAPEPPVKPPEPVLPVKTPVPEPPIRVPELPDQPKLPVPSPTAEPKTPLPTAEATKRPATATPASKPSQTLEILVKFEAGRSADNLASIEADLAAQPMGRIPQLGVEVMRITSSAPDRALAALRHLPGVVYVEPNHSVHILELPGDPDAAMQWHLDAIEASAAWDLATGAGTTIALIDTGVDPGERDLKDNLVAGFDFVNDDAEPWDDQGHGTRVALIAAAAANNGYGGAGVAYEAQVMPVKALNHSGSGTHAWLAKAIVWAADHDADVINLSVGGPYSSQTLQDAVSYAWQRGVLLIAAAGNENSNVPAYPAAYDPVLAVAGTTRDQRRASFSNWGEHVSVAAPGTDIFTTHSGSCRPGNGTSLAAPQVAGVAALVLSHNPGLSADQVRDVIQSTSGDLGDQGWDPYYGFGQVNAFQAVLHARRGTGGPNPTAGVIEAVNHARQLRGLPDVRPDTELMASAQERAEGLAAGCSASTNVSLASCLNQANRASQPREVVLVDVSSPEGVVNLLAASPAGQELVFGPYAKIGVGYLNPGRDALSQVWVLRFAREQRLPRVGPPRPIPKVPR